MNEPFLSESDLLIAATSAAICDVFAFEIKKLRAVVDMLLQKGLVSPDELTQAIRSIGELHPETLEKFSASLQDTVRDRTEKHLEVLRRFGQMGASRPQ